ncbi:hypothetical protein H5T53_06820 [Candidatus Bipolaricaulota bacterium]|nr:hypothetical protein [Candidatus Bipolaricaulota bacterium]
MAELEGWLEWAVPEHGFRWAHEAPDDPATARATMDFVYGRDCDVRPPWLIAPPHGERHPTRTTLPFKEAPELHRRFAGLPLTKDAILAFANEFGSLVGGNLVVTVVDQEMPTFHPAESLGFWQWAIQDMRDAVHLWDLLRGDGGGEPNVDGLREVIRWEGDRVEHFPAGSSLRLNHTQTIQAQKFAGEAALEAALGKSSPGPVSHLERTAAEARAKLAETLSRAGRVHLGQRIIAGLQSNGPSPALWAHWRTTKDVVGPARLRLLQFFNEELAGKIDVQLVLDSGGSLRTRLVPKDLLTGMWLMFFFEVTGKTKLRRCPICRTWFDVTRSPKKTFCDSHGAGCRQKASRMRKKARALLAQGKSPDQVAQELGFDPDLVRFLLTSGHG